MMSSPPPERFHNFSSYSFLAEAMGVYVITAIEVDDLDNEDNADAAPNDAWGWEGEAELVPRGECAPHQSQRRS
jgi:hypothetical protein